MSIRICFVFAVIFNPSFNVSSVFFFYASSQFSRPSKGKIWLNFVIQVLNHSVALHLFKAAAFVFGLGGNVNFAC